MRRFEYVGGGSEKFWEIDRDGASVTVRFGRLGTNGQTQVKNLASGGAAEAHVAKLVAEKLKKGYVEGGAAAPPVVPAPQPEVRIAEPPPEVPGPDPDEDAWTVPAAWWRQAEPFRGRGPQRPAPLDPEAPAVAAELSVPARAQVLAVLENPRSDAELVAGARRFLGVSAGLFRKTRREADPVGAAVVATVVATTVDWQRRDRLPAVVDEWVAAHGLVFAAEAGALLATVQVLHPNGPYSSATDLAVGRTQPNTMGIFHVEPMLARLRALLAAADETEYAEAVRRLAKQRQGSPGGVRVLTSYLLPTEQEWLDDDIAMLRASTFPPDAVSTLLSCATTPAQATSILAGPYVWCFVRYPKLAYSVAAHVGPAVAPVLARVFDADVDADTKKRLVSILSEFPTDEAFELLLARLDQRYVQPGVLEAMARSPRRAMRLLAEAAAGTGTRATTARDLLRGHVISHPELVEPVRQNVRGAAAQLLERLAAGAAPAAVASPDAVPAILVTPPWATRRARPKPLVVEGLGPASPMRLAWKPGEQAAWAETDTKDDWLLAAGKNDWSGLITSALRGSDWRQIRILAMAPVEAVRPHLRRATPVRSWDTGPPLRRLLGRLGDDALDFVFRAAVSYPTLAGALLPVEGSEVAARMAEWYARSKSVRPLALAWFDRHPAAAARDLVPPALGKPGKDRVAAETALRVLDQRGHRAALRAAARAYGPEALEAVDAVLALDPLDVLPARMPALPAWLDPAHLAPVMLKDPGPERPAARGAGGALPASAVGHLCTMLAISKPGDTYAGVDIVREAVDPGSLAEMAWSMFERWRGAGYPSAQSWVLESLGLLGDDETVRRLSPLIRAWPGESAHTRAVAGLEVLSAIGSDVALMHLHGIAQKAKFKGLKTRAQEKMDEVADGLGLTAEQLADRLVPDFGLDQDGSLLLDYGARRFRVGFDEQLKPVVADEDGSRRKILPKPSAKDDQSLAPTAYALFSGLKKDVKTVAADQIRRFERAMVTGRRWTAAEHRTLFVEHPLLWHLVRRLVWGVFDDRGAPVGSFRVAEDRTLADSNDDELSLDDAAVVGIAHPLHLGDSLGAWSDVFADYEILQPFSQLGREVFALTETERNAKLLSRFAGWKVYTGKILGLSHRGWERGMAQDAGIQGVTYKAVGGGRSVVIDLDPGILAGEAMEWPEQTIAGVWLHQGVPDWGNSRGNLSFGLLDPITASEALRDIESLHP